MTPPLTSLTRTGSLLLAGASLTALSVGATLVFDAMGTKYAEKRVFDVSYSTETITENLKMEMIRDGESMDRGGRGGGGGRGGQRGGGGNNNGGNMLADGTWEVTGTLTDETREVDGVKCAVIKIAAEVEGEPEAGNQREGMTRESSYSGQFEGELLFCVEEGHPVSFEVTGGYELSSDSSFDSERGSMEMSRVDETKITLNVTVAARAASDDE